MQNDSFYDLLQACLTANGICCGQTGSAQQVLAASFDPGTCSLRVSLAGIAMTVITPNCNGDDAFRITTDGCPIEVTVVPPAVIGRTSDISRGTGPVTVTTPYQSISITAISGDVTIDSGGGPQAIPANFNWNVGIGATEVLTNSVTVDGTDYILTVVV